MKLFLIPRYKWLVVSMSKLELPILTAPRKTQDSQQLKLSWLSIGKIKSTFR